MGAQFIHENAYSVNLTAGSKKENSNTVATILAEATRQNGYCDHVENPLPPVPIYGNINNVSQKCQEWLDETKDPSGKKVRKDSCVLLAGVVSCAPEDNYKWEDIRDATLKYLIEKFGEDRVVAVVEHIDEPFQDGEYKGTIQKHLHYYVVPRPGEQFENIHEGKKAVAQVKKNWVAKIKEYSQDPELIPGGIVEKLGKLKKGSLSPAEIKTATPEVLLKSLKLISNANAEMIFYKQAMKKFQDEYYSKVGIKLGLTRDGPKRMRLSRAENNARKQEANRMADAIVQAKTEAYEEGKKFGYEQGLKSGLLKGYEDGFTQGEIDAKADNAKALEKAKTIGYEEGKTKALAKAKAYAKKMYKDELAKRPITKLGNFSAGVKSFFVENPYIKKLTKEFNDKLNKTNIELGKIRKDLEQEKINANNRVAKISNDLILIKSNKAGLEKELDKSLETIADQVEVIQAYKKYTGVAPDNLPKYK
jgi:flagellar biosynthesis/type III secretory pathway protein FliH